jgi:hypothetical protein
LSTGNAVILKGGKEAEHSLIALHATIRNALATTSIPPDAIQLLIGREYIQPLLKQDRYIDLVIPRGSNSLVRSIQENTRIPVLGHADGLCSIYIDSNVDIAKAIPLIVDAKVLNRLLKLLMYVDKLSGRVQHNRNATCSSRRSPNTNSISFCRTAKEKCLHQMHTQRSYHRANSRAYRLKNYCCTR